MYVEFKEIVKYLENLGYEKEDIINPKYRKHFVAFYYWIKRNDNKKNKTT
jgi:hypothetical protein